MKTAARKNQSGQWIAAIVLLSLIAICGVAVAAESSPWLKQHVESLLGIKLNDVRGGCADGTCPTGP